MEREINKKVLTIEDIIEKKEKLKAKKETKTCYIESSFLGGNLTAHKLSTIDMAQVRDAYRENAEKGVRKYIRLSIDQLQDIELLKAFGRNRGDSSLIVDDIFNDGEKTVVVEILDELNGLVMTDETAIFKHTVEELKGE